MRALINLYGSVFAMLLCVKYMLCTVQNVLKIRIAAEKKRQFSVESLLHKNAVDKWTSFQKQTTAACIN